MRKDRFTYRQKNYVLLGIFILMLMVSYKRSFVLTLNAKEELKTQREQLKSASTASGDIEMLMVQIAQLNKSIGKSDLEADKVQQKLLATISDFSEENDTKLDLLEKTHSFKTVDYIIYSNLIAVQGNFPAILEMAYEIENNFDYARLTNLTLHKEKDHTSKTTTLYGKFLFQHFRQL